ncbi:uncharacterized protein F5147DRAFT_775862 [Suillus discolor]|uniref:Uncharacterized protein n=1 Tax=Suillus discolor TaxID=1912936 RepID=A0A9P7F3R1_9AGAM|nr:uncharacterized protein F5147DRAFT_775862 [Suillus discolor]KAG2103735.1 hypothetical protein F5147DRAFT_775862 [Suillus discolor]
MNRTGRRYIGHFDVPLKNRVASLCQRTSHALSDDTGVLSSGWVNGDDYEEMQEPFGILPFDDDTLKHSGMLPFSSMFVKENDIRYVHLSQMQVTRFAVLPVHSCEERALFQAYAESSPMFAGPQQPDFVALASLMNGHADGTHIFYKLPEHIKTHYKTWLDYSNKKSSVTLSADATRRIRTLLEFQVGSPQSVPTALPQQLADTINAPTNPSQTSENPWQLEKLLADHRLAQSALQYSYGDRRDEVQAMSHAASARRVPEASRSEKCAAPTVGDDGHGPSRKKNKPRTCMHCKSTECKGRWAVKNCAVKMHEIQQRAETQSRRNTTAAASVVSGSNVMLDADTAVSESCGQV